MHGTVDMVGRERYTREACVFEELENDNTSMDGSGDGVEGFSDGEFHDDESWYAIALIVIAGGRENALCNGRMGDVGDNVGTVHDMR